MAISFPLVRSYAQVARTLPLPESAPAPQQPIASSSAPVPPPIVNPDAMRLARQSNTPLQPETVCKILCRHISEGKTPAEIAHHLMENRSFIFRLLDIPLNKLQAAVEAFPRKEIPNVWALSESVRLLYLFALSTTELITTIRTYENNFHGELDRLFEISEPEHWSLVVGANCKSWKRVEALLKELISRQLKKDRELLIENAKRFRSLITDLKELERALSLNKKNLLFLSRNCYCDYEGGDLMFPHCKRDFPPLFRRLDCCQTEFPCRELLVALSRRSKQCKQLLDSIHPPKTEETELDSFYFMNDRVIYQAALELLSDLAKRSGVEEHLSEKFLYGYCNDCFGMDLNEWMQLIIAALPPKNLLPLSKNIYKIDSLARGRFLCNYLVRELKLPKDLASFKTRFEFQEGETA